MEKFRQLIPKITIGLVLILIAVCYAQDMRNFSPPEKSSRVSAIGETRFLPVDEKVAFSESKSFSPKVKPGPSDWLANHRERGQTFDQFLRARRNMFREPRTVIYIQPLGDFPPKEKKVLDEVATYAKIFFNAEVKVQETLPASVDQIKTRKNPHQGQTQILSTDVLKWLKKDLPRDAYARIAVTMTDLYPDPSWNFVFGQASLTNRTGVYSFARYGEPGTAEFLRRCLRVFSHETGHMFAFMHCIHYQCLMNGSNHLEESDETPLHLCPICLRKLYAANHFDIKKRYGLMQAFFDKNGLSDEHAWVKHRLEQLNQSQ